MNNGGIFNEIKYDLDVAALTEAFDVVWFAIEERRSFARTLSRVMAEIGTSMLRSGSGYLLLLDKDGDDADRLADMEGVRCKKQSPRLLASYDRTLLVRALIRALPRAKSRLFSDAAIGLERGLHYLAKEVGGGRALKSLRIDIDSRDGRHFLAISQQTFLRSDFVPETEKKKRLSYRIEDGRIRLQAESTEEKTYYLGAFGRKWGKDIPFYDFEDYRRCKLGVLARFKEDFNWAYEGICSIKFVRDDPLSTWRRKVKLSSDTASVARHYPEIRWNLVIVEKDIDIAKIKKTLPTISERVLVVSDAIDPDAFNLLAHYKKERYKNGDDPYRLFRKKNPQANISSITPDTVAHNGLASALEVISKEAVVKEDIRRGRLSAAWIGKEMVFGFSFFMDPKRKMAVTHLMRIDRNGTISHAASFPNSHDLDALSGMDGWLRGVVAKAGRDVPFCCDVGTKEWLAIETLPKFPMPDPERLHAFHEELEYTRAVDKEQFPLARKLQIAEHFCAQTAISPKERASFMENIEERWVKKGKMPTGKWGAAFRNHLLDQYGLRYSSHGLKGNEGIFGYMDGIYFDESSDEYYVGTAQPVQSKISKSVKVRKIKTNAHAVPEWFFRLMEVGFVKNKDLTVLPYPFKYLREYIKRWHLSSINDEWTTEFKTLTSIIAEMYD